MPFLRRAVGALAVALGLATSAAHAETGEVRFTRQPGLIYMPMVLAEQQRLVEKHVASAGLGDVKVSWVTLTSGGASVDALISGNVDFVTSGATNLLLAWDRTRGEVKGLAASAGAPMMLVTRNPAVKTLADFSAKDRIAVPTVKVSAQAVMLQIAAERQFGEAGRNKLDALTVQLGHPDAVGALLGGTSEVNSHFSLPPYQQIELKDPKIHVVLNSYDVVGGPLSNAIVFGRGKFMDQNPKTTAAVLAAIDEANALIRDDPNKAAEIYLAATKEKFTPDELVAMMKQPGVVFSATPYGTMLQADHLAKAGVLKNRPKAWTDFFAKAVHDRPGT
ncbi:ABC transporter substrate-binding protein [Methylobacterium sp. SyP6R]|uniref:ABC transporter substrate-binding protein n=1 Tax=Methylobacterium sp. SyP6R TaxID=2718876 RepID=UPI001F38C51C|nr:ABC transporter substrate-binding protein [Methylobacterium sp. SyP6R]MCF4128341.1 ABC transporter substrate-binding protein [Methylobacterium sp. SyP6R]